MGNIFGGGPKKPEPLPPLPERDDPAIQEARDKERISRKRRKGRASTILTRPGLGSEDEDENPVPKAKLLGE